MVALFIYIYTLVASRSEFYTSILCEVIKIRKKKLLTPISRRMRWRTRWLRKFVMPQYTYLHTYTIIWRIFRRQSLICLTRRKIVLTQAIREVGMLFSQYYVRDACVYLAGANETLFCEVIKCVCIFFFIYP